MKYIKLTQNKRAIIDNEDFELINQFKWFYHNKGYAMRNICINGKWKMQQMHRVINNTPDIFQTDHINRNRLDNRRKNLRTVTNQLNQRNASLSKNNTSGFIGVHFYKRVNRWMAYIWVNYKKIHLGYFDNSQKAYQARIDAERKYWI